MSWIKKHWSDEYITLAESQIKQTVSPSYASKLKKAPHIFSRCGNIVTGPGHLRILRRLPQKKFQGI